jgi:hypothetical protein
VIPLRNSLNNPQSFSVDVAKIFELEQSDPAVYKVHTVWHDEKGSIQKLWREMRKGRRFLIHLAPFEVITMEALPAA